jgi:hypothetical protein
MISAAIMDCALAQARPNTRHGAPGNHAGKKSTQKTRRAFLRTGFQAKQFSLIKTP